MSGPVVGPRHSAAGGGGGGTSSSVAPTDAVAPPGEGIGFAAMMIDLRTLVSRLASTPLTDRISRNDIDFAPSVIPCTSYVSWRVLCVPGIDGAPSTNMGLDDEIGTSEPGVYEIAFAARQPDGTYLITVIYVGSTGDLSSRLRAHARGGAACDATVTRRIADELSRGATIAYRAWKMDRRAIRLVERALLFAFRYECNEQHNSEEDAPKHDQSIPATLVSRTQCKHVPAETLNALVKAVTQEAVTWAQLALRPMFSGFPESVLSAAWTHYRAKHPDAPPRMRVSQVRNEEGFAGERWTNAEDTAVYNAVSEHGKSWSIVRRTEGLSHRTESAIASRWQTALHGTDEGKHAVIRWNSRRILSEKHQERPNVGTGVRWSAFEAVTAFVAQHVANVGVKREDVEVDDHDVPWRCLVDGQSATTFEHLTPADASTDSGWYTLGVKFAGRIAATYCGVATRMRKRLYTFAFNGGGQKRVGELLQGVLTPATADLPPLSVYGRWTYVPYDVAAITVALHQFCFDFAYNGDRGTTARPVPAGYTPVPVRTRTVREIPKAKYRPISAVPWTTEMEAVLVEGYARFGDRSDRWVAIRRAYPALLGTFTPSQLQKHHARPLSMRTKRRFTQAEDDILRRAIAKYPSTRGRERWTIVKREFPELAQWSSASLLTRERHVREADLAGIDRSTRVFGEPQKPRTKRALDAAARELAAPAVATAIVAPAAPMTSAWVAAVTSACAASSATAGPAAPSPKRARSSGPAALFRRNAMPSYGGPERLITAPVPSPVVTQST